MANTSNRTNKLFGFDYPSADKIGSRTSTIARSMASTLMPRIGATEAIQLQMAALLYYGKEFCQLNRNQQELIKKDFDKDKDHREIIKCVYCGDKATHLDHLYPLVDDKNPTGFASEPANLVPCCGKCNQSKGSKLWDDYMNLENYNESKSDTKDIKNRKKAISDRLSCNRIRLENGEKITINLETRKAYLKKYSEYFKFIDKEGNNDERKLKLLESSEQINNKWTELYSKIKNALENAEIQIAAFYAGFEDSVMGENTDFDRFLKEYKKRKKTERLSYLELDNTIIENAKNAYEDGIKHGESSDHDRQVLELIRSDEVLDKDPND